MADLKTSPAKGANAAEFSVSELSSAIKRALEDGFGYIRLRGEISGYRGPHASGHCYFALKDERAKIEAVIWRGVFSRLKVKPEDGMEVIATGKVSSYPGSSKYQIVIDALEPAGLGAMMVQLEERKKRLAAEGLFDDDRKQKLPYLPKTVGVVTSPTGAVIRDILAGFTERFPTRVLVWPVKVQGEGSAQEIARAIRGMNSLGQIEGLPQPDIIIVARGGGSLEDLWSFNDEEVVRAVAASKVPIVSAVGHETDWTLIDLAADARAPTPTKAAEWAVPKHTELIADVADRHLRLQAGVRRRIEAALQELKAAVRGLPRLEDLIRQPRQRFDMLERRLAHAFITNTQALNTRAARAGSRLHPANLRQRIQHHHQHLVSSGQRLTWALRTNVQSQRTALAAHSGLLHALGYRSVLGRGYAIVRDGSGHMVRRRSGVSLNDALDIEFADGHIAATAGKPGSGKNADQSRPGKRKQGAQSAGKSGGGPGGQGSLF